MHEEKKKLRLENHQKKIDLGNKNVKSVVKVFEMDIKTIFVLGGFELFFLYGTYTSISFTSVEFF